MTPIEQQLFLEVFPVALAHLPALTAYRPVMTLGDASAVGGKLAYRLRQQFAGDWVWVAGHIVTDTPPNPVKLLMSVDALIRQDSKTYARLSGVEPVAAWQPVPETLAEYILRGPLERLSPEIHAALAKTTFTLGNARVERDFRARAWTVEDQPALSFSIVSRLLYEHDLRAYAATVSKPAELVGLRVTDKHSTMQGDVIKVVGALGEHRERLIELSQRDAMRDALAAAAADDLVVRVESGRNEYDYAASTLNILLGIDDAKRFDVNAQHAIRALRLKPGLRAQMVKIVADIAKAHRLIGDAYSTRNLPAPFRSVTPEVEVALGGSRTRRYDVDRLPLDVEKYGVYWWRERFQTEPLRLGIINTLTDTVEDFMEALARTLEKAYPVKVEVTRERKVRVISQANLESAVRLLQKENIDLIVAFFEDDPDADDEDGADDHFIKAQTVGRGIPCLVLHESTLNKPEAMPSILMGIIARAGNVPYLLDNPLAMCDFVVGLDLIREEKKDADVVTGVARVYRNDGALLCYLIASAPLGGDEDGIPQPVLERLFPGDIFAQKRVMLHIDGGLRRDELVALGAWEAHIDTAFYSVEIMRRNVPRIYTFAGGKIRPPEWGSAFRLNEREAFIVTASAPNDATPQPIHIRTAAPLTIEQAIDSVMIFATLHYGALKTPKLPVTTHHAEHVRASVLRGVMPDQTDGDLPFWL